MEDCITYDIPVSLMDAYRGRTTIVRSGDPSEITQMMSDGIPEGLSCIRILSPDGSIDDLKGWVDGMPIDLVIREPREDLPVLYRYAPLLSAHPLRVSVPLVAGFGSVVKLAASLNYAVKVEGGQPDESVCGELLRIAHYYLHRATVTEPIDFFHSLFLAFYKQDPMTLWAIQEEDPQLFRHIADSGEETMAGRLAGMAVDPGITSSMDRIGEGHAAGKNGCDGCQFLANCRGYFKWPRKEYCCDGVKMIMSTLRDAADELRRDVASYYSR
jgi:hypothetical protein